MQSEYFERIAEAVAYIEAHLGDGMNLQDVAEQAGYSVFHFSRIFQGMTGESVMEYARKRRLSRAACALVETDKRILDIALDYQYESQEAFARSFKRAYGMTPGAFRRQGKVLSLCPPLTLSMLTGWKGIPMEPEIVQCDEMIVVGLEYIGKNENMEVPALWDVFNPRACEVKHTVGGAYLGVCGDMRPDGSFSYVAGRQVSKAEDIPEGMVAKVVPPATYAVFTHCGPLFAGEHDLQSTYASIYREWLPNSAYERADTPDFELYDERFAWGQEKSEFDIYIPIKPR